MYQYIFSFREFRYYIHSYYSKLVLNFPLTYLPSQKWWLTLNLPIIGAYGLWFVWKVHLGTTNVSQKHSLFQEPIKCKSPGNPENGYSFGEIYTVGAQVTFSCEEGHQLMGVTEITCLESGEWSHLIPHCEGTLSKFFVCIVFGNLRNLRCRNVKCYVISVFFMFKTQPLG